MPEDKETKNVPTAEVRRRNWVLAIRDAFLAPTLKQKEAQGRFFHTLSAACIIGATTVIFTEAEVTAYIAFRVAALIAVGVLPFTVGSILSKGE